MQPSICAFVEPLHRQGHGIMSRPRKPFAGGEVRGFNGAGSLGVPGEAKIRVRD